MLFGFGLFLVLCALHLAVHPAFGGRSHSKILEPAEWGGSSDPNGRHTSANLLAPQSSAQDAPLSSLAANPAHHRSSSFNAQSDNNLHRAVHNRHGAPSGLHSDVPRLVVPQGSYAALPSRAPTHIDVLREAVSAGFRSAKQFALEGLGLPGTDPYALSNLPDELRKNPLLWFIDAADRDYFMALRSKQGGEWSFILVPLTAQPTAPQAGRVMVCNFDGTTIIAEGIFKFHFNMTMVIRGRETPVPVSVSVFRLGPTIFTNTVKVRGTCEAQDQATPHCNTDVYRSSSFNAHRVRSVNSYVHRRVASLRR